MRDRGRETRHQRYRGRHNERPGTREKEGEHERQRERDLYLNGNAVSQLRLIEANLSHKPNYRLLCLSEYGIE